MEASSHGLDQRRLDGVHLAAAGFTNITRDHLDYHADFEAYFEAKLGALRARAAAPRGTAVVNLDDPHGPRVRTHRQGARPARPHRRPRRGLLAARSSASASTPPGRSCSSPGTARPTRSRLELIGGFQAHNALVAAGLAIGSGSDPAAVIGALPGLRTVRGRMERAATRTNGAAVFVDYAHTPDALTTALTRAPPARHGPAHRRLRRRRRPRPRQAAADGQGGGARRRTSSSSPTTTRAPRIRPRSAPPSARARPEATEIGDRAEAILTAVDALQPGDALLIAGKGHETGQIVGQDILPFDDLEQASVAVAALDGLGA